MRPMYIPVQERLLAQAPRKNHVLLTSDAKAQALQDIRKAISEFKKSGTINF